MAMTEQEWLACTDPQPMLEFLRGKASDRKFRLFVVACCRVISKYLDDDEELSRSAEVAEAFADGHRDRSVLRDARDRAYEAHCFSQGLGSVEVVWLATVDADQPLPELAGNAPNYPRSIFEAALLAPQATLGSVHREYFVDHPCPQGETIFSLEPVIVEEVNRQRKRLVRSIQCIFGLLPFRPMTIDPPWLTANVTVLAQSIYDDRAFDRLPILADALEDAGCDNADILNHCRDGGEHVRGCWVVDLILGKQ
jgi:hypothetical protein